MAAEMAALKAELDSLRAERVTSEVMAEHSLPKECATLLHGNRDAQVEQARILARLIQAAEPAPAPSVPVDPAVTEAAADTESTRLKEIQAFLGLN